MIVSSRAELQKMLQELAEEAEKAGLEIHFGETEVLATVADDSRHGKVFVKGEEIEIVPYNGQAAHLGRSLSLSCFHNEELQH